MLSSQTQMTVARTLEDSLPKDIHLDMLMTLART